VGMGCGAHAFQRPRHVASLGSSLAAPDRRLTTLRLCNKAYKLAQWLRLRFKRVRDRKFANMVDIIKWSPQDQDCVEESPK